MDIANIVAPHILSHLPDGFQKGQSLDIADGAAHFHYDNLDAGIGGQGGQPGFDFVSQMGDGLNGAAQKIAAPFLVNQGGIDLPGGNIGGPGQFHIDKPLVMAQIQVRLPAVPGYENLSVLIGRHGAGIHIQIGIQLDHGNGQPPAFEDAADRGYANPLADGTDHAAGDEYILGSHAFQP